MPTKVVLVEPFHPYGVRFAEEVAKAGATPVCVHTGGARALRRGLREYPQLRDADHRLIPAAGLRAFGARLAGEGELAAIAITEASLASTLEVLRGAGSDWNREALLAALRDKYALKQLLREAGIDAGWSERIVRGALPARERLPERFVLKPNDGYGNSRVGFFTRASPESALEEFVRAAGERELVAEEFHPGAEYFVNGQTDERAGATVVAVFRYERVAVEGAHVDWLTHKVPHSAPEFAVLAGAARRVVAALGLRRSPFHLELRLCDGHARVVELGARLAGNGNAFVCNDLHGGALDVFALATRRCLHDGPQPAPAPDWDAYDRRELVYVHGVALEDGFIWSLDGLDALEAHPRFAGWVRKPFVGQRLRPTADVFSSPYCFLVQGPRGEDLRETAAALRALLRINARSPVLRAPMVRMGDLLRRVAARVGR